MKTNKIILIISLLLICIVSNVNALSGSGTEGDPYQITTCLEFEDIENNMTAHYKVMNDIDCNGVSFESIGSYTGPFSVTEFTGVLDGDFKTISDFSDDEGLFAYLGTIGASDSCLVKKLTFLNPTISTGGSTAGVVAMASGYCRFEDILIDNPSVTTGGSTGGIVGMVRRTSYFDRVGVRGGFINCGSTGVCGGVVGDFYSGGTLNNTYSSADVSANNLVGGLIGDTYNYGVNIYNSYSAGNTTLIAGYVGTATYGAFVGRIGSGTLADNYWNSEATEMTFPCGGSDCSSTTESKTEAEMKSQSTYVNWDFTSVWDINESLDYPILLQIIPQPISYVNLIGVSETGFIVDNINPITIDYIVYDIDSAILNCSLYYSEELNMSNKVLAENDFSVLNNVASKLYITLDFFDIYDEFNFYYQVECNDGLFFEDSNIRQVSYIPRIQYSEADIPKAVINVIVKGIILIGIFIVIFGLFYLLILFDIKIYNKR